MESALIDAALNLPPDERLDLLDRLWASLVEDRSGASLSAGHLAELARREQRLAQTGPLGEDWEAVERDLLKRLDS